MARIVMSVETTNNRYAAAIVDAPDDVRYEELMLNDVTVVEMCGHNHDPWAMAIHRCERRMENRLRISERAT